MVEQRKKGALNYSVVDIDLNVNTLVSITPDPGRLLFSRTHHSCTRDVSRTRM
jgi:hypothetical protein